MYMSYQSDTNQRLLRYDQRWLRRRWGERRKLKEVKVEGGQEACSMCQLIPLVSSTWDDRCASLPADVHLAQATGDTLVKGRVEHTAEAKSQRDYVSVVRVETQTHFDQKAR